MFKNKRYEIRSRLYNSSYAFTEQGVAMLSSVLRSQTAIEVNIQIMRAFVSMRHFMVNNASVFSRLKTMEYHQLEILHTNAL